MDLTRTLSYEFGESISHSEGIVSVMQVTDPAITAFGSKVGVNTTDNLD